MTHLILEDMLKDGYSKKYAQYFLKLIEEEKKNPIYDPAFLKWAHGKGFTAESASVYGLTKDNAYKYLSDYDYYKVWPLNNWSRIWINDKLTLRYVLSDKDFTGFMPRYYYYSTTEGLKALMDNPYTDGSVTNFIKLLKEISVFACKPCNGTQAQGFYKLSYQGNRFYINDHEVVESDIAKFVEEKTNYLFTEYLYPSLEMSRYGSIIHTLRVVVLNEDGCNPRIIGGYLRLPNKQSGAANYILHDGTNNDQYNIYTEIDWETGRFGNALKVYANGTIRIDNHPDTGAALYGTIRNFEKLKQQVLSVSRWLNNIEFMGFDLGITDHGVKCMEINSHPGHMLLQMYKPLYEDDGIHNYFHKKLNAIDAMTEKQILARNRLPR